jgi:molybdopterin-containing oxidoreductase family iron-sulfur binding subunit
MSDVMVDATVNHGSTVEMRMPRYGMVIDLKRCYGCYACVMACKTANHTPPGVFWARLLKGEMGKFPNTVRQSLPVLCMQCEEPSCLEVCPTGATVKLDDGVVIVEKDKCMGCKYCMMACPYGARYSVEKWESYFPDGLPLSPYEEFTKKAWEEKSGVGVATKCDFCRDRVAEGSLPCQRSDLRRPGRPGQRSVLADKNLPGRSAES